MRLRTGYTIIVHHHHHPHNTAESSVYSDLDDDDDLLEVEDVEDPLLRGLSSRRFSQPQERAVASTTTSSQHTTPTTDDHGEDLRPLHTQFVESTSSSELNLLLDDRDKTPLATCRKQELEHRNEKNDGSYPSREPLYSEMLVSIPLDEEYDDQGDSLLSFHKLSCLLERTQTDGNSTLGTSITSAISSLHRSNTSLLPVLFQPIQRRPHMHRRSSCTSLPNIDEIFSGSTFEVSPPLCEDTSVSLDTAAAVADARPHEVTAPSTPHHLHFSLSLLDLEPPLFGSHATMEEYAVPASSPPRHHRRNPTLLS